LKKILAAFALLCLTSCHTTPPDDVDVSATIEPKPYRVINSKVESALDRYYFTGFQYKKTEVNIRLVLYTNYDDIARVASQYDLNVGPGEYVVAFSKDRLKDNVCEIHMLDPEVSYRPEFTGHEMLHCFYGQFHGSNDTKG
jgi:hypothetical protein